MVSVEHNKIVKCPNIAGRFAYLMLFKANESSISSLDQGLYIFLQLYGLSK